MNDLVHGFYSKRKSIQLQKILPAWVANHNTCFSSSCLLAGPAIIVMEVNKNWTKVTQYLFVRNNTRTWKYCMQINYWLLNQKHNTNNLACAKKRGKILAQP